MLLLTISVLLSLSPCTGLSPGPSLAAEDWVDPAGALSAEKNSWYVGVLEVSKPVDTVYEISSSKGAAEKARAWAEEVQNGLMLVWIQNLSNSTQLQQCAPAVQLLNERVTLVWAAVCLQDVHVMVPHLAKLGNVKLVDVQQSPVPPHIYFLERKRLQKSSLVEEPLSSPGLASNKYQDDELILKQVLSLIDKPMVSPASDGSEEEDLSILRQVSSLVEEWSNKDEQDDKQIMDQLLSILEEPPSNHGADEKGKHSPLSSFHRSMAETVNIQNHLTPSEPQTPPPFPPLPMLAPSAPILPYPPPYPASPIPLPSYPSPSPPVPPPSPPQSPSPPWPPSPRPPQAPSRVWYSIV